MSSSLRLPGTATHSTLGFKSAQRPPRELPTPVASWSMADPGERRAELDRTLEVAAAEARAFLARLDDDPVQPRGSEDTVVALGGELPEDGEGAPAAISELASLARAVATRSAGPRFFHFVIGGATPAALAADWLTASFDQNASAWVGSPLASRLESICLEWLREMFELPSEFGGVLVTGGTMANFACLAVARDWCAERNGAQAREVGLAGLRQIPVFSSGYIHASAVKSLALLGIGASNVHKLNRDPAGRLDLDALERSLADLNGAPAIVVANAGECEQRRFRPDRLDGRPGKRARRLAPRRWGVRALRPYLAPVRAPRRWRRTGPHPRNVPAVHAEIRRPVRARQGQRDSEPDQSTLTGQE